MCLRTLAVRRKSESNKNNNFRSIGVERTKGDNSPKLKNEKEEIKNMNNYITIIININNFLFKIYKISVKFRFNNGNFLDSLN